MTNMRTTRPKEVKFARPTPPSFTDVNEEAVYAKERLMLSARILAREGYDHCGTYLSIRDRLRADTLWTIPRGVPLSTVLVEDLVQLDFHGEGVTPGARSSDYDRDAVFLHIAMYTAPDRSDIHAVIHSHAPHSRAFAASPSRKLEMISQDAATFHNRWTTVPLKASLRVQEQPELVQQALGSAVVVILAQRGSLAVHANIESALGYWLRLDGLCYIQLLAEAASKGRGIPMVYVSEEAAAVTVKGVSGPHHAWTLSRPNFIREERFFAEETRARAV